MEDSIQATAKRVGERETVNAIPPPAPPRPFPYYPPQPPLEMQIRNEAMMDLDKWANNDPEIAKRSAETLILILAKQFNINLVALNP